MNSRLLPPLSLSSSSSPELPPEWLLLPLLLPLPPDDSAVPADELIESFLSMEDITDAAGRSTESSETEESRLLVR